MKIIEPVAVDLFAGAGFMGLGFTQAGFDVRVACEFDRSHAAAHQQNFPATQMLSGTELYSAYSRRLRGWCKPGER